MNPEGIPTDNVDEEFLAKPRKWAIDEIKRFILYIGPLSSIFDYVTFFVMLHVFKAWNNPTLFQTGWFVESLLSQTLIVHIIRTGKIPFIQSRPSVPLLITTTLVALIGVYLPYSPFAEPLGLTQLPHLYWGLLSLILLGYSALTQSIKVWLIRRYNLS